MTIKKPMKVAEDEPTMATLSAGGATIADRFKLDVPDPNAKKPAGVGAVITLVAALIALGVVGFLVFELHQHLTALANA